MTDPSRTTGADFATTVLGNPWDMSASNDIVGAFNISPITFSNGQLHGTNTNGDPGLEFLNNANNAGGARAIDTSRYRYLTYRLQVDGPVDIANGSVTRVFWSSGPAAAAGPVTTTRDIVAFAGMRSYTVDLASLSVGVTGGLESDRDAEVWTTNNKRYLRFDPHEFAAVRNFHIDDVKLTAIPEASGAYHDSLGRRRRGRRRRHRQPVPRHRSQSGQRQDHDRDRAADRASQLRVEFVRGAAGHLPHLRGSVRRRQHQRYLFGLADHPRRRDVRVHDRAGERARAPCRRRRHGRRHGQRVHL